MDLLQRSILYSIRTVDTGSEVRLQYTSGTACFFLLYWKYLLAFKTQWLNLALDMNLMSVYIITMSLWNIEFIFFWDKKKVILNKRDTYALNFLFSKILLLWVHQTGYFWKWFIWKSGDLILNLYSLVNCSILVETIEKLMYEWFT